MSITASRRVSGPSSSANVERKYSGGGQSGQFVEHIDTSNNVLIHDDPSQSDRRRNSSQQQFQEEESQQNSSGKNPNHNYVPNALEALAASGVYDETVPQPASNRKVGVYDSNQSIVEDEAEEKLPQTYLKHLYEKNRPMEEVDELV